MLSNGSFTEHRAQIFEKVDVKFYSIFLLIKVLEANFG